MTSTIQTGDIVIDVSAVPGAVLIQLPTGDVVLVSHRDWLHAASLLPKES